MPSTYTLISSNVLASSAASVTFSAIPSTYTDLVLRASTRLTDAFDFWDIRLKFNADVASNYSITALRGSGTTATSARQTSATYFYGYDGTQGTATTSNTFTSTEIYLPNYLASTNKPASYISAIETNATASQMAAGAHLWRNTAAITAIEISTGGYNFVSGSSFYLYGIKNS